MKRLAMLISLVLTWSVIAPTFAHAEPDDALETAGAYILIEASTCTVLEERDSHKRLNIGYLSKLMTLLLIAEDIETGKYLLSTELTASLSVSGTKGSVVWLESGDKMTVEELVKSVIIGNANDAVTVLAEKSEQSVDSFVRRMNTEAFDLGLRDTAFYSPYGYADEREYSTAFDLAVICAELSKFEFLRPYFATWRDFVREGRTELVSENTLARTYSRHIGFKETHSSESYSIAEGASDENGDRYIAVILDMPDRSDAEKCAKNLVNTAFRRYKLTATMFPDEMMKPIRVRDGESSAVGVHLRNQSRIVIPTGVSELRTAVVLPEYLNAPVKQGQIIGTAGFYNGKELVCEAPIVASEDVNKLTFGFVFKKALLNLLK